MWIFLFFFFLGAVAYEYLLVLVFCSSEWAEMFEKLN